MVCSRLALFRQLWIKEWPRFLFVFLVSGLVLTFAAVLSRLYADKTWSAALASLPLGLILMFFLNRQHLELFSFGYMWINVFEAVLFSLLFIALFYCKEKTATYEYGMVALAFVLWLIFVLTFTPLVVPQLSRSVGVTAAPISIRCPGGE